MDLISRFRSFDSFNSVQAKLLLMAGGKSLVNKNCNAT